jgi:murein DD-endopeptidase MepM/ murein hydrolase activator NlpD
LLLLTYGLSAKADLFLLPTSNRAIYEKGAEEKYFVPTVGKTWVSGTFGCVRSDGYQIHEGLDVHCLQRDKHGEPIDPVMATADGTVAYINNRPSLSNYGNYVVLRHNIQGLDIYSTYAHLHSFAPGLKVGKTVKAGEVIAIMGRTANTREGISKERAHVHYELDLFVSDHFNAWYKKNLPGERNDHGLWNGQNLTGIDARLILLQQHEQGDKFSLVNFLQSETTLCRVFVRDTNFPWLKRYPQLIKRNPIAEKQGIAGYEMALDYNGAAVELIPRAASEIKSNAKYVVLSVNETEEKKNPARRLVAKHGTRWELTSHGTKLLDLFTY